MAAGSRIVFMGTPEFAVPSLELLAEAHDVAAVFSQPPRPSGRGMKTSPSAVHDAAGQRGIPVHTPDNLDGGAVSLVEAAAPDFLVVVAYGLILPEELLAIPGKAAVNGHASLLPRWRGAAPVQRAIEAGDDKTGTSVMVMERGLDSGPVLLAKEEPILPGDTTATLHDRLAQLTAGALLEAVNDFDSLAPVPQDESKATWAGKITPAEAEIDFGRAAAEVERRIRAFAPHPGAWFSTGTGARQRIKVLAADVLAGEDGGNAGPGSVLGRGPGGGALVMAADTAVELARVQPQGKPPMDGAAFLNGYELPKVIRRSGGAPHGKHRGRG